MIKDITRELKAGRAILVVFKDEAKLQKFSREINRFGVQVMS
jgi:hypothetical protein